MRTGEKYEGLWFFNWSLSNDQLKAKVTQRVLIVAKMQHVSKRCLFLGKLPFGHKKHLQMSLISYVIVKYCLRD